ncbi:MAG: TMEM175 family protein [Ginsengibacter sp.]
MFRKAVANKFENDKNEFRFRGHEVRRIEAFSDAVFAFAVTLLIVSLEVPKSFDELLVTMRGFFAFGVSFTILMMIWYEQNIFFRRYGMDDLVTIVLNCTLIFLVLFYVYPLKFLFTLVFSAQIYGEGHSPFIMQVTDNPKLMMIYGVGYILIYLLFFFMYIHALRRKNKLQLTASEIFDTKTKLFKNIILIAIGLLSVFVSQVIPAEDAGVAGMVYILIGPAFSIFYGYRSRRKRKLPVPGFSDPSSVI